MSKIGKKPITIPDGVTATITASSFDCTGKNGKISVPLLPFIAIEIKDKTVLITPKEDSIQARSNWGTMASLISNAFAGVTTGFSKTLEIEGVGFRATMEGKTLILNIGFTHPVKFTPEEGVTITVQKNVITISGISKQLVGQTAAHIRGLKKPEPYKGKGIHYLGEVIRRKAGKKVAGTGSEK